MSKKKQSGGPSIFGTLSSGLSMLWNLAKYLVGYVERVFRYAWNQTGWVFNQSTTYYRWVRDRQAHFVLKSVMLIPLLICIPMWIGLIFWGFIRSLFL